VKDPDKVLIPGSDLVLIAPCENEPEDYIPFALLTDIPLHLGHGSAIDSHRKVDQ
jgi:hypothetical protein